MLHTPLGAAAKPDLRERPHRFKLCTPLSLSLDIYTHMCVQAVYILRHKYTCTRLVHIYGICIYSYLIYLSIYICVKFVHSESFCSLLLHPVATRRDGETISAGKHAILVSLALLQRYHKLSISLRPLYVLSSLTTGSGPRTWTKGISFCSKVYFNLS